MANTPVDDNLTYVFVVAGSIIEKDGKFLLVQEKQPKAYGLWNLPAGKVEKGDSVLETAIKEAKEETGFDVEIKKEIGIYHKDGEKALKHVFEAIIVGGKLNIPEDEILDAKWLSYGEVVKLNEEGQLRDDWILDSINKYAGR